MSDPRTRAQEALDDWDEMPQHGNDPDHCPVCYGSCGAWAGERVGDVEGQAEHLAAALRDLLAENTRLETAIREALAFEATLPAIATVPRGILVAALSGDNPTTKGTES